MGRYKLVDENDVILNVAVFDTDEMATSFGYVPATDDDNIPLPEITWDEIREKRNTLLAESDWTILPDSPKTDEEKTEWMTYRQTLRDVTTDFATPDSVEWPLLPGVEAVVP